MEPVLVLLGAVLVVLGAAGATVTQRRFEQDGWSPTTPLWFVPFGVLVGAGAAMARGWDVWIAIAAGAVVIPLVAAAGRIREVRRARRRRGPRTPGGD